ncbi:MAG TPA: hypothetical protein VN947_06970 [Polyangia bacterium]|nr:hypothetical protein [Polyangia bacterium]
MRALVVAVVVAVATVSVAAVAVAAPTAGREQYDRGARAFHEQRWAEARAAFEAAYQLDREPELLYDIALAMRRQAEAEGDRALLAAARDAYKRYLDASPNVRRRAQAEEAIGSIEAQLPPPAPSTPTGGPVLDPWPGTPAPASDAPATASEPPASEPQAPAPRASVPPPSSPPRPANVLAAPPSAVNATSVAPPPRRLRWVVPVVVVGSVVVVALAVGLGVGLSSSPSSSSSGPSLGTVSYP